MKKADDWLIYRLGLEVLAGTHCAEEGIGREYRLLARLKVITQNFVCKIDNYKRFMVKLLRKLILNCVTKVFSFKGALYKRCLKPLDG